MATKLGKIAEVVKSLFSFILPGSKKAMDENTRNLFPQPKRANQQEVNEEGVEKQDAEKPAPAYGKIDKNRSRSPGNSNSAEELNPELKRMSVDYAQIDKNKKVTEESFIEEGSLYDAVEGSKDNAIRPRQDYIKAVNELRNSLNLSDNSPYQNVREVKKKPLPAPRVNMQTIQESDIEQEPAVAQKPAVPPKLPPKPRMLSGIDQDGLQYKTVKDIKEMLAESDQAIDSNKQIIDSNQSSPYATIIGTVGTVKPEEIKVRKPHNSEKTVEAVYNKYLGAKYKHKASHFDIDEKAIKSVKSKLGKRSDDAKEFDSITEAFKEPEGKFTAENPAALASIKGVSSFGGFIDKFTCLSKLVEGNPQSQNYVYRADKNGKSVTVSQELDNMKQIKLKDTGKESPILDSNLFNTKKVSFDDLRFATGAPTKSDRLGKAFETMKSTINKNGGAKDFLDSDLSQKLQQIKESVSAQHSSMDNEVAINPDKGPNQSGMRR